MAVATATGVPVIELPPLHDVIDPDALEAIFRPGKTDRSCEGTRLTFAVAGCTVCLRDDTVTVTADAPAPDERAPPHAAHARTEG